MYSRMECAGRREGAARDGAAQYGAVVESTGETLVAGLSDGRIVGEVFDGRRSGRPPVDDGDGLSSWVETEVQVRGTAGRI